MPNPEQRLDLLEPMLREMLAKQDQLAAQQDQLSAQLSQLNARVLQQLSDQGQQVVALQSRLGGLENGVEQGFTLIKQRLTDLFTLLGGKFK